MCLPVCHEIGRHWGYEEGKREEGVRDEMAQEKRRMQGEITSSADMAAAAKCCFRIPAIKVGINTADDILIQGPSPEIQRQQISGSSD
jgi:hypothetical protein